jgi:acetyltransferase-like isoleucine patch superfamily enzyme
MISDDAILAPGAVVPHPSLVNIYGCRIGHDTKVGPFVEIQSGVDVGARCKVSSHAFICEGVTIEDDVFIGHGVMFTNDRFPRAGWRVPKTGSSRGWSFAAGRPSAAAP